MSHNINKFKLNCRESLKVQGHDFVSKLLCYFIFLCNSCASADRQITPIY